MWTTTGPKGKDARSAVNASRRTGDSVVTDKKIARCVNRSAHCTPASSKKFVENKETIRQEAVSHEFRTAMHQVIMEKKMSQTQLATANSEKRAVINAHESGKAIVSGVTISELKRALGARWLHVVWFSVQNFRTMCFVMSSGPLSFKKVFCDWFPVQVSTSQCFVVVFGSEGEKPFDFLNV